MSTQTGNTGGRPSERTYIIEPLEREDGRLVVDRERAADLLLDMLSTLVALGGKFEIMADRVKVGEIPREGRPPEPIGETLGFVAAYRTVPKIEDESVTLRLLGVSADDGEPEPEPDWEPADDEDDEGEE
jgi:hypothetical protein